MWYTAILVDKTHGHTKHKYINLKKINQQRNITCFQDEHFYLSGNYIPPHTHKMHSHNEVFISLFCFEPGFL